MLRHDQSMGGSWSCRGVRRQGEALFPAQAALGAGRGPRSLLLGAGWALAQARRHFGQSQYLPVAKV